MYTVGVMLSEPFLDVFGLTLVRLVVAVFVALVSFSSMPGGGLFRR